MSQPYGAYFGLATSLLLNKGKEVTGVHQRSHSFAVEADLKLRRGSALPL